MIYYFNRKAKIFMKQILGFTTLKKFKKLYPLERLNLYYLVAFFLLTNVFYLIEVEHILFQFFFILVMQNHLLFL